MKIEDVKLGKQYRTNNGMVGKAMNSRRDPFRDGLYEVKLVSYEFSRWVDVIDIEPVDEGPNEAPLPRRLEQVIQMSIDENHDPLLSDILNAYKMDIAEIEERRACTGPLSIADTPVSQMTFRMHLIAQGFAGWAASSRSDDRDIPAIPIIVDELIAEMEKTKK